MKKSWFARVSGPLKYAVGFALLAYVIWSNWASKYADVEGVPTLVQPGLDQLVDRAPQWPPFALAAVLTVCVLLLQYLRWYLLVRALDLPFTVKNALRLGLVGTFYNMFLPGAIGGDVVKAFYIAGEHPERKAAAAATVFADRLIGLFGMLLFGAVLGGGAWAFDAANAHLDGYAPTVGGNSKLQLIVSVSAALCAAGAIGYVCVGFVSSAASDRLYARLRTHGRVGRVVAELWYTARQFRGRPGSVFTSMALSITATMLMVVGYHFCVRVFPPDKLTLLGELSEHFVIAPIGFIAQAIIPVPGGVGVGEFTFGGLYELIRGPEGRAVGLVGRLTLRVIEWGIGLGGYVMFLTMKKELPGEKAADADIPAAVPEAVEPPPGLAPA